jgi:predicted RNase H-like HicB family nuclease
MKMQYEIVLAWSEEDSAFVAHVPDLPGCAAHGATYEEALAQIKEAAALWLDVAREEGQAIPQPTRRLLAA